MLSMSRTADYALVGLAELAAVPEQKASATSLAEATGIPLSLLRNILKRLSTAGLLRAHRGPFGGYSLARHPDSIGVLEVIEAIDSPVALARCCDLSEPERTCSLTSRCRIRPSMERLHDEMFSVLRSRTIASLAESGGGKPHRGSERSQNQERHRTTDAPGVVQ